jgi:hypothetical protein
MIAIVQGPPGSGKTLHVVQEIADNIREGKHVWTNVRFVRGWHYLLAMRLWRKYLMPQWKIKRDADEYLSRFHLIAGPDDLPTSSAREESRLVVFDESQMAFNCRETTNGRMKWLRWFSQSRKYGCDVLMVAQDHQMIDRQLRMLAEQTITCWNLKRLRMPLLIFGSLPLGYWISKIVGPLFFRRATMNGMKGLPIWKRMEPVPLDIARLYDTLQIVVAGDGEMLSVNDDGTPQEWDWTQPAKLPTPLGSVRYQLDDPADWLQWPGEAPRPRVGEEGTRARPGAPLRLAPVLAPDARKPWGWTEQLRAVFARVRGAAGGRAA